VAEGLLVKGQGRGGSVRRSGDAASASDSASAEPFALTAAEPPTKNVGSRSRSRTATRDSRATSQPQKSGEAASQILSYRHRDKRVNNPEVGMVTPRTDPDAGKTRWAYDPHLDPALQFDPQRSRIEQLID